MDNKSVMDIVRSRFKSIFGYKLVELKKSVKACENAQKKRGQKKKIGSHQGSGNFVLVSALKTPEGQEELNNFSEAELPKQGLLMIIYSLIMLNQGSIFEQDLWRELDRMGISRRDTKQDEKLGDVGHLVQTTFCKQRYLERIKKRDDSDQSQGVTMAYAYVMGRRGYEETDLVKIFEFTHQVIGKSVAAHQRRAFQAQLAKRREAEDAEREAERKAREEKLAKRSQRMSQSQSQSRKRKK